MAGRRTALVTIILTVFSSYSRIANGWGFISWTKPKPLAKRSPSVTVRGHDHLGTVSSSTSCLNANDSTSASERSGNFWEEKFNVTERKKLFQATKSGLAVSLAMVPEAVAFAFVAGVSPLVGLWTTVVLGFVAAAMGGRAGLCSSASGACSVVVASLSASHGPAYLSVCAIMAGLLQIVGGFLGVGKLMKLIPHPVMLGFVNGLAIVMTKAQLVHFKTNGSFMSPTSPLGASTYGIAALTMVLVKIIPKVTKAVPPSLGAVVIASLVAKILALPAKTLADVAGAATFKGGWSVLPTLGFPNVPWSLETLQVVFPYALTMASVGVLESLLTMQILDDMADDGKRGSTTKECVGQGTGNILSGLTQGIGGCVLLGQSIINMQSGGGKSRWSGMSMAVFLATGIVAAAPLLANVPVSALVGVMLLVCQSTFSWSSLRLFNKIPKLDAAVIALVSIVTFQKDLAIAVVAGTVLSSVGFAYKQSTSLSATYSVDPTTGIKTYKLRGPLFFGSTRQFEDIFASAKSDPATIRLDFSESRVLDHSAVESIENLSNKYTEMGKTVQLDELCMDSTKVLSKYVRGRQDAAPFEFSFSAN
ncbi:sulfate permease family protein [Nitzschia inconspicua]|uniref:Sulfate permease family protein n=1 Tax=Nitzschia inconspicua TaxID=303405 RepID=A0A9K3LK49_9STRA|nr:sulfate permease family protein [Nitzschia inconspicua]